jgi:TPR repeat protein
MLPNINLKALIEDWKDTHTVEATMSDSSIVRPSAEQALAIAPPPLAAESQLLNLPKLAPDATQEEIETRVALICDAIYTGSFIDAGPWLRELQEAHGGSPQVGSALALATLGHCSDLGLGTLICPLESAAYYNRVDVKQLESLAQKGNAHAQFHVGRMLDLSKGHITTKLGRDWRIIAAKAAFPLVLALMLSLLVYLHGQLSGWSFIGVAFLGMFISLSMLTVPDFIRASSAMVWYRLAVAQGYAHAKCNLGLCYYNQRGVFLDRRVAAQWFHEAAEQGYAHAEFCLGYCYNSTGRGVEKDRPKAISLFEKAHSRGHAGATFSLARCYELGKGVSANSNKALTLHKACAALGHVKAKAAISDGLMNKDDPFLKIRSRKSIWGSLEEEM